MYVTAGDFKHYTSREMYDLEDNVKSSSSSAVHFAFFKTVSVTDLELII